MHNLQLDKDKKTHLWFFFVLVSIAIFFTSGIIFGWASLLLVFLKEGQFSEYCVLDIDTNVLNCDQQTIKLNLIYAICTIVVLLASPVLGTIVDKFGCRVSLFICSLFITAGTTLASFSDSKTFNWWIPAFVLLNFGTAGVYFSVVPSTQYFRGREGLAMSVYNCSFDSSTLIFIVYKTINTYTDWSLHSFFLSYNAISVYLVILVVIWPVSKSEMNPLYQKAFEEDLKEDENVPLTSDSPPPSNNEPVTDKKEIEKSGQYADLPFFSIFKTYFFWIFWFFYITSVFWLDSYIGFVEQRLNNLTNNNKPLISKYVTIFSFIMPGSIFLAPVIGTMIDKKGIFFSLLTTHIVGTLFCCTVFVERWIEVQVVNYCLFSLYRALFYSSATALMPHIYGYSKFGRIYGFINLTCSVFMILQNLLMNVTINKFGGNWLFVNILQLSNYAICFAFFPFLYKLVKPSSK